MRKEARKIEVLKNLTEKRETVNSYNNINNIINNGVDYEQMVKDELANGKFPVIVCYPDEYDEDVEEIIDEECASDGIWIAPANLFLGKFYHNFDTTPIDEEMATIKNVNPIVNQFAQEMASARLSYPMEGFMVLDGSATGDIISAIKSLSFVDSVYLYDMESDKIIGKL